MAVATALAIVAAGTAIYSGIEGSKESARQRKLIDAETAAQAAQKEIDIKKFMGEQELAFLSSGVVLQGSPLSLLKETRDQGNLDLQNIKASGKARSDTAGLQGRSAFFSGLTQAVGYGANAYSSYNPAKTVSPQSPAPMYTGGWGDTPSRTYA